MPGNIPMKPEPDKDLAWQIQAFMVLNSSDSGPNGSCVPKNNIHNVFIYEIIHIAANDIHDIFVNKVIVKHLWCH